MGQGGQLIHVLVQEYLGDADAAPANGVDGAARGEPRQRVALTVG